MSYKVKLGIIGCGAIGSQLARAICTYKVSGLALVALTDIEPAKARQVAHAIRPRPKLLSLPAAVKQCDLLVEAAGAQAFSSIARAVVRARKNLLLLSVGALIEQPAWIKRFAKANCHLHFPSGAISGLDGLKAAAAVGSIRRVCLTTRKPLQGLQNAPFFKQKKTSIAALRNPTIIFTGSARRAIRLFPANVNVAAAVSLLGLGPDRTRVKIIADPQAKRNTHTLEVWGEFGRLRSVTENVPSPDNPKTSYIAAASAFAALRSIVGGNQQGT